MVQKTNKEVVFTVDWEDWYHGVKHWFEYDDCRDFIYKPTKFLLALLKKYEIKAIWYVTGHLLESYEVLLKEIKEDGHTIGWHGYWHEKEETSSSRLFRSPYWANTPMPLPPSGGFFFRALPYPLVKAFAEKSGVFWIHPHDVLEHHPRLDNKLLSLKRNWGLKNSRAKLDKLCKDINWIKPQEYLCH